MIFRFLYSVSLLLCSFTLPNAWSVNSYSPRSSGLTINITTPSVWDIYSDCASPHVVVTINTSGAIQQITLLVELPPSLLLDSEDWIKRSNQEWSKAFTLPATGKLEVQLPVKVTDKSALASALIKVSAITQQDQSVVTEQVPVSSRSATVLSSPQQKGSTTELMTKKILSPLMSDCGISTYYIAGELVVDQSISFDNQSSQFIVSPESRIVIKSGTTLSLNNAVFSSCGKWSGIYVEPGANLLVSNTILSDSDIPVTHLTTEYNAIKPANLPVSIFPNPASSETIISTNHTSWGNNISVLLEDAQQRNYNITPKILATGKDISINVSTIPNGFYALRITNDDGSFFTGKLLIEHK